MDAVPVLSSLLELMCAMIRASSDEENYGLRLMALRTAHQFAEAGSDDRVLFQLMDLLLLEKDFLFVTAHEQRFLFRVLSLSIHSASAAVQKKMNRVLHELFLSVQVPQQSLQLFFEQLLDEVNANERRGGKPNVWVDDSVLFALHLVLHSFSAMPAVWDYVLSLVTTAVSDRGFSVRVGVAWCVQRRCCCCCSRPPSPWTRSRAS